MILTFNKKYFIVFLLLFLTEVAIAYYLKSGFIRHTFGDFLVAILLYCFFKSFIKDKILATAITTLGISFVIEFLQLTPFLEVLGIQKERWANLIFGNCFSVKDLVAYTLGIATTMFVEKISFCSKSFFLNHFSATPLIPNI